MDLDAPWDRALELAWEGYRAGTTPVGALVLDAEGGVVGEGRGRRHEQVAPPGRLANTHIAHAEVNALAALPPSRHYEDHVLLTTLEPCCMCLGATVQSTVTTLHYAASDPYAGSTHLDLDVPQARRRPLHSHGPLDDVRGRLAELLHLAWLLDLPAGPAVMAPHLAARPGACAEAARLGGALHELRDAAAPLAAVLAGLRL